jgi:hypothetical protein
MDIEHFFGLSRFRGNGESHEQDGERLTRVKSRTASASSDPAMALGPFRLTDGRSFAPPQKTAAASLPDDRSG